MLKLSLPRFTNMRFFCYTSVSITFIKVICCINFPIKLQNIAKRKVLNKKNISRICFYSIWWPLQNCIDNNIHCNYIRKAIYKPYNPRRVNLIIILRMPGFACFFRSSSNKKETPRNIRESIRKCIM